jgi:hypothetical protein
MRMRVVLIAAGVAGVLLLGPLAWLRGWLAPAIAMAAGALAPTGQPAAEVPDAVLREQVAHLGSENTMLRARLADYAAISGEGRVDPAAVVVARGRIISRTRRVARRYLELDVGRVDGVAKGMAVVMGWTLVGQVTGTDDGRCLVQEITDSESRVASVVLSVGDGLKPPQRLSEGVLAGRGRRGELALEFVETAPDLVLSPGMAVVTAGVDGRFPVGLVLGEIRSASHAGGEAWQVTVAPQRDPQLAESLLVLRLQR